MGWYRIWDLTLASAVAIPELPPSVPARPDWTFSIAAEAPRRTNHWFHHWLLPDGRRWLDVARHDAGYHLRFQFADFDVLPHGRALRCYRRGAPLHTVRHLLLDQVLPLVAGGKRRLALHASAVALSSGAVGFLGGPGQGKSTLAAALTRAGHALIADDCLLVMPRGDHVDAIPGYPGVRLNADSRRRLFGTLRGSAVSHVSRKQRIAAGAGLAFLSRRRRVVRLYVIDGEAATIEIRRMRRLEAMMALVRYVFHLDVRDPTRLKPAFDLAAATVEQIDVRSLRYPRRLDRLDAVAAAIDADG